LFGTAPKQRSDLGSANNVNSLALYFAVFRDLRVPGGYIDSKRVLRQFERQKILTSDEESHQPAPCSVMQLPEVRFCQEHG
ncbi:MAG TPA: hypothetical protein VN682_28105, partial [Terriglobales bacterium]|nr:hypothetical protein [Terriglobales bacterium]